jgi:hypothetical protein
MAKPELKNGKEPVWYHPHGDKLYLSDGNSLGGYILLCGSAAHLKINAEDNRWKVDWHITNPDGQVEGYVMMDDAELSAAFNINSVRRNNGKNIQNGDDGIVTVQGKFIRYGDYLNIPGPGTGHDGDPNVSVLLNEDIKIFVGRTIKNKVLC